MTMPSNAAAVGRQLPSDTDRAAANQLRRLLAAHVSGDAKLKIIYDQTKKPADVTLTPALSGLLMEVLRHFGKGDAVTLVPVSQMLTTQQAADILNVSRPFLIGLLERGVVPFELVGRHRRVRAETLFDYKRARDAKRSEALAELAALDGEQL
jgi:excisionase family DNA binding protein